MALMASPTLCSLIFRFASASNPPLKPYSTTQVLEYSLTLRKGARSRLHEDALVSRLVLQALADASHVRHHCCLLLFLPIVGSSRLALSHVASEGILHPTDGLPSKS